MINSIKGENKKKGLEKSPMADPKPDKSSNSISGQDNVRPANIDVRGKELREGTDKVRSPHQHRRETHGMSDDFDANTPISEFKGPNLFERAKEEFEALIDTIHPKRESSSLVSSPKKEAGIYDCLGPLGKGLEKVCSPGSHKKD